MIAPNEIVDLGYRPRPWQENVHRSMKRYSVLVVHRRGGKTVLAVMKLIDAALRSQLPKARYAYVAPLLKQSKDVAWDYVKSYVRKIPGITINESELWVELPNGARIRLYGADNPDAMRGIYLDGIVLDEVADMRPEMWHTVARPALADRQGWALFIGTPKGVNMFSELYYYAVGNPAEWYAGLLTCYDTDAILPDELKSAKAGMPDRQFRQEFLCDFAAGAENALLTSTDVEEAARRHLREDQYSFAAKTLGVDVARQGDDSTVIIRRQGLATWKPRVFHGMESMAVAGQVAAEVMEWRPDAVFIDGTGGYGAGVIDRLRDLRMNVIEVQFGGQATDGMFLNKRAEMWWKMAEWIKAGGSIYNDVDLKRDLCAPTYSHNSAGKFQLESKDQIKKRGMPSPDRGDSLCTTFAHPVMALSPGMTRRPGGNVVSDWNPIGAG